jgi:hypothetical protein
VRRLWMTLIMTATFVLGGAVLAPQPAISDTCSASVSPYVDIPGSKVTNPNFVIDIGVSELPGRYAIYFDGVKQQLDPHGLVPGGVRFGVGTRWALAHPLWMDASRWDFYYNCGRTA